MRYAVATVLRRPFSAERTLNGWLSRAAVQPSAARQYQYGTFLEAIMRNGFWPLLDLLHIHGASDQTLSKENLVSPSFPYTEVNAPTWTADRGFAFNGTTQELTNPFTLSLHANNFRRNSAHAGAYSLTAGSSTGWDFGDSTTVGVRCRVGTNGAIRLNGASSLSAASGGTAPVHIMGIRRDGSTAQFNFRQGVQTSTAANTSTALPANTIAVGRALTLYSDRQIFMTHLGAAPTDAQALAFYTAALALAQAIGAA